MSHLNFLEELDKNINSCYNILKNNPNVEELANIFKDIYKIRHELFASDFLLHNEIDYKGDTNFSNYLYIELEDTDLHEKYIKTETYTNRKLNKKTPDYCYYDSNTNIAYIVDFSVRNSSTFSFRDKISKYSIIPDDLSSIMTVLIVVVNYNVRDENIDVHKSIENLDPPFSNRKFNYKNKVKDTEKLLNDILTFLNPEEQDQFNSIVYQEDRDYYSEGMKINYDFGMNEDEYKKFCEKNKNTFNHLNKLIGIDVNKYRLSNFETSCFDSDRKVQNEQWSLNEKTYSEFIQEQSNLMEKIEIDKRLQRPNYKDIKEGFTEMENICSSYFKTKISPGMLSPFPLVFSEFFDYSTEKDTKQARIDRLLYYLKIAEDNDDSIALKQILLTSEIIEQKEESARMDTELLEVVDQKEALQHTIKNNQYIMLKKDKTKFIKEFELGCGYGKKFREKIKVKDLDIEKKESLPFWNNEDLQGYKRQFKQVNRNIRDFFINASNSEYENNGFLKDYIQNADKFGRGTYKGEDSNSSESSSNESPAKKGFSKLFQSMTDFLGKENIHTMSKEQNQKYNFNDIKRTIGSCLRTLREYEVISENILYIASKSSKNYRLVQGLNSNMFVLLMPGDSLLKSNVDVGAYTICLVRNDHDYVDLNNIKSIIDTDSDYKIIISKGYRLMKNKISCYNQSCSKFIAILESYNSLLQENGIKECDPLTIAKIFLLTINININTSSMFDNVRYMTDNCLADMSCCKEYLLDKFKVPCKNLLQIYIYNRSKKLLLSLNRVMEGSNIANRVIDEDDNVDLSYTKIGGTKFQSILCSKNFFVNLNSLLQEIQILYFSTPKALHGWFHNITKLYTKPIDIQTEFNKEIEDCGGDCYNQDTDKCKKYHRFSFSLKFMELLNHAIEKYNTRSISAIRVETLEREMFNKSPLMIKTMSSTRSLLVNGNFGDVETHDGIIEVKSQYKIYAIEIMKLKKTMALLKTMKEKKKFLKDEKRKRSKDVRALYSKDKDSMETALQIINSLKLDYQGNIFFMGDNYSKTKFYLKEKGIDNFLIPGTVLSETIKFLNNREEDKKEDSLGTIAKELVLGDGDFISKIDMKGQRSQDDREIYTNNFSFKTGVYILEHLYKSFSQSLIQEKISVPGDEKIIDMYNQVKTFFNLEYKYKKENKEVLIFNFNLDMTKWAPKDNLIKFIPFILKSSVLKKEEKNYIICCLIKYYNKKLYINDGLLEKLLKNIDAGYVYPNSNLISECADEEIRNMIPLKETWMQGQLNYPSSAVHAGLMLVFKDIIEDYYRKKGYDIHVISNVHSDDNQTSVLIAHKKEDTVNYDKECSRMWSLLTKLSKKCCIELSIKKSNISRHIKQFVSQYNIGGEQIYLWVKQILSCISGLPFIDLKNDYMSVFSKISEAASKGAPERACRAVLNSCHDYVSRVYGVMKNNKNVFSKILHIDESLLPVCLGGGKNIDISVLAMLGPKACDLQVIVEILRRFGATSVTPPIKETTNDMYLRAAKLISIIDTLSQESTEIDIISGLSNVLNPFKPTRFKTRMKELNDPYYHIDLKDRQANATKCKEENPTILILKPKRFEDLYNFYNILYLNPSFQSAMANQSPDQLLAYKIANRNSGNFKFLNESNIGDNLKEQKRYNPLEVAYILLETMSKYKYNIDNATRTWHKFIKTDPEFQQVKFTHDNCEKNYVIKRKNPIPCKKPFNENIGLLMNPCSLLLMYYFEEKRFKDEKREMRYLGSTYKDLAKLSQIFPEMYISLDQLYKENPLKYTNFGRDKINITRLENISIKENINRYIYNERLNEIVLKKTMMEINDIDNKTDKLELLENHRIDSEVDLNNKIIEKNKLMATINEYNEKYTRPLYSLTTKLKSLDNSIDQLQRKLSFYKREMEILKLDINNDMELTISSIINVDHSDVTDNIRIKETFCEKIAENLLKISRSFTEKTKKVLFVSPTSQKDIPSLTLSLKGLIEGNFSRVIDYSISQEALRRSDLLTKEIEISEMNVFEEYCKIVNVAFITGLYISADVEFLKRIIKSVNYKGYNYKNISTNYLKCCRYAKRCLVIPMKIIGYENVCIGLLENMDPINVTWAKDEDNNTGMFDAMVLGMGCVISIKGENKMINRIEIIYQNDVKNLDHNLDILLKRFCSDLVHRDQYKDTNINLSKHLKLSLNPNKSKYRLYYDPINNRLTSNRKHGKYHIISIYSCKSSDKNIRNKDFRIIKISEDFTTLTYSSNRLNIEYTFKIPYIDFTTQISDSIIKESVGDPNNWREAVVLKDLEVGIINFTRLIEKGLWKRICNKKSSYKLSTSDCVDICNSSGSVIKLKGPYHSQRIFTEMTNILSYEDREDIIDEKILEIILSNKPSLDKNLTILQDSQRDFDKLRVRESEIGLDEERKGFFNKVLVLDEDQETTVMMDINDYIEETSDFYDLDYKIKDKDLGIILTPENIIIRSTYFYTTRQEENYIKMIILLLSCQSVYFKDTEKLEALQGGTHREHFKFLMRELEKYTCQISLEVYIIFKQFEKSPDYEIVTGMFDDIRTFLELNSDSIRLELKSLFKLATNNQNYYNRYKRKSASKQFWAKLNIDYDKALTIKTRKDYVSHKSQSIIEKGDIKGKIDAIRLRDQVTEVSDLQSEISENDKKYSDYLLTKSKRTVTQRERRLLLINEEKEKEAYTNAREGFIKSTTRRMAPIDSRSYSDVTKSQNKEEPSTSKDSSIIVNVKSSIISNVMNFFKESEDEKKEREKRENHDLLIEAFKDCAKQCRVDTDDQSDNKEIIADTNIIESTDRVEIDLNDDDFMNLSCSDSE